MFFENFENSEQSLEPFQYAFPDLSTVSPSKFGFQSNLSNLPEELPYGFWIDRHGNFMPVGIRGHEKAAMNVVKVLHSMYPEVNAPRDMLFILCMIMDLFGWFVYKDEITVSNIKSLWLLCPN